MEHLAREVARLAWQLQRDVEDLRDWANETNQSSESPESVDRSLERIEAKLGAVHDHTTELIDRVPSDLGLVLSDLKGALLVRLEELIGTNRSVESVGASRSGVGNQATDPTQSAVSAARLLTLQERRVFQLCFQSGFLSYRDIASHLDITPTAAKNLVNRIFLSDRKRVLFTKEYAHGAVRVGLRPDVRKRAPGGGARQREGQERTSGLAAVSSAGPHEPAAAAAAVARHPQQAGRRKATHVL